MSSRTRLTIVLLSMPLMVFAVVGGWLGRHASARENTFQHLRVFEDVVSLIVNNYFEEANTEEVLDGAMRGLAEGLDPDCAYLTPEQARQLENGDAAPDGTTGIELTRQFYLRVVAVRDRSPAAKAGLRTGDYVRAIDGKSTRPMSVFEGRQLLAGAVGSSVKLTVLRGSAAEPHDVALTRAKQPAVEVTARMQAPGVGYLRIAAFGPQVADEVAAGIEQLKGQGATRLIVDVRHTAEGEPEAGIDVARLFVKSGTLGIKEVRNEPKTTYSTREGDGSVTWPVVLLATNGSSSAAETFAAALVGNKRATLIGEHTLGRAGLQKLVALPDGSGLWLTYARFLDPAGKPIHGEGLEPQVEVDEPDVEFGQEAPTKDQILEKGLEHLSKTEKRAA
ncbi:MAG: PDZ domain-containing protein [Luteitalea sp.]|nr:PDZ domain-containing protein [Luteitalea sp.]